MWNDTCGWVRSRLPLMAGSDLLGVDRRRTQRHLIGCPACRHRLSELQGALDVLHAASACSPIRGKAPALWPELSRQIRETKHPVSAWPSLGIWSGLGLAAGLVVAVSLVYFQAPGRVKVAQRPPAVTPVPTVPQIVAVPVRALVAPNAPAPARSDEVVTAPVLAQHVAPKVPAAPTEALAPPRHDDDHGQSAEAQPGR